MSIDTNTRRSRKLLMAVVLLAGLFGVVTAAMAAATAEIQALLKDDRLDQAMRVAETALSEDADNVELRFLKGIIHTRRNELDAAAAEFLGLTQDHPDLPEPYNNLAVVYAAKGEYDKARQTLLRAINTHPSYATAYENIGDIYTKMASEAYIQALQLDESNIAAREKLAMVNELFSASLARQSAVARAEPQVESRVEPEPAEAVGEPEPAEAEAPPPELIAELPDEAPAASPGPTAEPQPPAMAEPEPAVEVAAAEPAAPAPEPGPEPEDTGRADRELIESTVQNWARAWAAQDVESYLAFYSDDFRPGGGQSRADWAAQRRDRLTSPRFINVELENIQVQFEDEAPGKARARFRQTYQSNTFNSSIMKTLHLGRVGDDWQIKREVTE